MLYFSNLIVQRFQMFLEVAARLSVLGGEAAQEEGVGVVSLEGCRGGCGQERGARHGENLAAAVTHPRGLAHTLGWGTTMYNHMPTGHVLYMHVQYTIMKFSRCSAYFVFECPFAKISTRENLSNFDQSTCIIYTCKCTLAWALLQRSKHHNSCMVASIKANTLCQLRKHM